MSNNKTRENTDQISPINIHRGVTPLTSSQQPLEAEAVQIGARIRAIRKQRRLIENDRTSPNIRTLGQLAEGLGVSLSTLVEPESPGQGVVYQQQGQRNVTRFANGMIENLGAGLPPLGAEPILVTLDPGQTASEDVSHAGREFVYCIEGGVACIIGGTRYPLSVGDSLLFDADIPHRWENIYSQSSRLLVLFCPMDVHDHPVEQHLNH
jgi:quercetin dioxygenase-like cupin family protein